MATTHGRSRESGFLLSTTEWTIMAGAAGLAMLNVLVMIGVSYTPLVLVVDLAYSVPILGVVVYGLLLGGGEWIARKGVTEESVPMAVVGVGVLQFAFGTIGGWTLALVEGLFLRTIATGVAAAITVGITVLVGAYVYYRADTDFGHWRWISVGAFLLGGLCVLLGMFVSSVLFLGSFALFLVGFGFLLGWEIYRVRDRTRGSSPMYHSIGIYVAFMGVFVHVLRIVVRVLGRE